MYDVFFSLLYRAALSKADALLTQKHGIVRLDNIWGTGGGIRPVKHLIKKVNAIILTFTFPTILCAFGGFFLFCFLLFFFLFHKRNTSAFKITLPIFPLLPFFFFCLPQIIMLLKEFLSSGDVSEATRCLLDLEVPHFHHELVYEVRN